MEIIRRGIYYSESITHLCLSHCGLNDAAGAMVANALISNEVCQVELGDAGAIFYDLQTILKNIYKIKLNLIVCGFEL